MLKAIVVAALGGVFSGHLVRNGIGALALLFALIGAETAVEAVHHHWSPRHDLAFFLILDTVGSSAVLVSEALSV